MTTITQASFTGGVMSPIMLGRNDDMKFKTGLKKCENFIVMPQGPVQNRPGFAYVGEVKNRMKQTRLIPFTYSTDQTVVLEFGHQYIRFWIDGKFVTASDGVTPYEIPTTYTEANLPQIKYVQSADVLTLVHPKHPPRELRRHSFRDWRLVEINFGEPIAPPQNVAAVKATSGVYHDTDKTEHNANNYTFRYVVTALSEDRTQESTKSQQVSCVANIYNTGTTVRITWDAVSNAKFYRIYRNQGGIWAYLGETDELEFIDDNIAPDAEYTPPNYESPFKVEKGIATISVTNGGSNYGKTLTATGFKKNDIIATRFWYTSYNSYDEEGNLLNTTYTRHERQFGPSVLPSDIAVPSGSGNFKQSHSIALTSRNVVGRDKVTGKLYSVIDGGNLADLTWGELTTWKGNSKLFGTLRAKPVGKKLDMAATITLREVKNASTLNQNDYVGDKWANIVDCVSYYGSSVFFVQNASVTVGKTFSIKPEYYGNVDLYFWVTVNAWSGDHTPGIDLLIPFNVEAVPPTVLITDSRGTNAKAKVTLVGDQIASVKVTNSGSGYVNPTVTFNDHGGYGSGAVARVEIGDVSYDYPSSVTYFEQRKVFAGTTSQPQAVWMTKTGTENNMSYCIPVRDDDRINFKIASRERNKINHLVSMTKLFVLTESAEWAVSSGGADAITPSSVGVKAQSYIGSSYVAPLVVNNYMLFVAARGGHVREMGYNTQAGGYVTGDVSIRAAHLFDGYSILDMAYSKSPYPIAWFVRSDGNLLGLTYIPEQNVQAWHIHTTDGSFESVCSVQENGSSTVYAVVKRVINGQTRRYIERLSYDNKSKLSDQFFVDCGGTYAGEPTNVVSNVHWLEGKVVNILADGCEIAPQVVKDGRIKLPREAKVVHVGLPIESRITTLPLSLVTKSGDQSYKRKNVTKTHLRIYNSAGIFVGAEDGELVEFKQRTDEPLGEPVRPATGAIELPLFAKWSEDGSVTVVQTSPLPLTILSIASDVTFGS